MVEVQVVDAVIVVNNMREVSATIAGHQQLQLQLHCPRLPAVARSERTWSVLLRGVIPFGKSLCTLIRQFHVGQSGAASISPTAPRSWLKV